MLKVSGNGLRKMTARGLIPVCFPREMSGILYNDHRNIILPSILEGECEVFHEDDGHYCNETGRGI